MGHHPMTSLPLPLLLGVWVWTMKFIQFDYHIELAFLSGFGSVQLKIPQSLYGISKPEV